MADIKAQLLGYQAELAYAKTYKKPEERIKAIEDAIAALEGPARNEVGRLRTAADGHKALNQDGLAALRRREADDLEALLPATADEDAEDTTEAEPDKATKAKAAASNKGGNSNG